MTLIPTPLEPPTFEGRTLPHPDEPVFDQGLAFDIETLLSRRQVLRGLGYLDAATDAANKIATSQIALPADICGEVYATAGYEQSVQNMRGVSLEDDNVFGEDDGERQLGAVSGTVPGGLTVDLAVPVGAA